MTFVPENLRGTAVATFSQLGSSHSAPEIFTFFGWLFRAILSDSCSEHASMHRACISKNIVYDISTERTYMFEIGYYTDSSGYRPVEKFIDSLHVFHRHRRKGHLDPRVRQEDAKDAQKRDRQGEIPAGGLGEEK